MAVESEELTNGWALTWESPEVPESMKSAGPVAAKVPGSPQFDLHRAGLGRHPLVADAPAEYRWCEGASFTYRRLVTLPERNLRRELVFYGIDGFGEIYLNGTILGRTANAHHEHRITIPDSFGAGQHELQVRVESGALWSAEQNRSRYQETSEPDRIFLRKPQYVFGWDWAPRLISVGLWRPVELVSWSEARLGTPLVRTEVQPTTATVSISVPVEDEPGSTSNGTLRLRGVLSSPGGDVVASTEEAVDTGAESGRLRLAVRSPELWYPKGYGKQPLYTLTLELLVVRVSGGRTATEVTLDRRELRIGIRTLELEQEPDQWGGSSFRFWVNGTPVFARGANWVPLHHLPGEVDRKRYTSVLEAAAEANYTMLRIWGGGIYEDDRFYEECDRLGILVWQDFMFACAEYPEDQESFYTLVATEAEAALRRIRNHPCLALLCGNNENHWMYAYYGRGSHGSMAPFYGSRIYEELLPELTHRLAPQLPYWPSSPYGGSFPNSDEEGDKHAWEVSIHHPDLRVRADITHVRGETARFVSEYGVLSLALPETVRQFTGAASFQEVDVSAPAFRSHDNFFNRGHANGRDLTELNVEIAFGSVPQCYEEYTWRSLYVQAIGYREAIAAHRRRLQGCGGTLFWMHRDVWGTHGWTVVDFYDRKKPSYYWVRRAFAPLALFVVINDKKATSWIANDTTEDREFDLDVRTGGDEPRKARHQTSRITVPAGATVEGPVLYDVFGWIAARLREKDSVVAEDVTLTHYPKLLDLPDPELTARWHPLGTAGTLELRCVGFAHFVMIRHNDTAEPEDNYFNLPPGTSRKIAFRGVQSEPPGVRLLDGWEVVWW